MPDPGAVVFDGHGTPMLTFEDHPLHGPGWVLSYPEHDGNGVEDHFVGGRIEDLDWALASAKEWLNRVRRDEEQ